MKAVVQRVSEASVTVEGATTKEITGAIGKGLLVLFCAEQGDQLAEADYFASKISKMRIFTDEEGKINLSLADIGGSLLAVSQFTLAANWRKGNRPGFSAAASPDDGRRLYEHFCHSLEKLGHPVEKGVFGARMEVRLLNDGPVTIIMDSKDKG